MASRIGPDISPRVNGSAADLYSAICSNSPATPSRRSASPTNVTSSAIPTRSSVPLSGITTASATLAR